MQDATHTAPRVNFVEDVGEVQMSKLPTDQHITYQLQYRKCGKPTCGTCKNGAGHGPYWYAYWREGAKLRSGYIGKTQPANVPAAVAARAEQRLAGGRALKIAQPVGVEAR
jgi:hypothetical protein